MSKFELRENAGNLFRNEEKSKDTDRDYRGEVNIEGRLFWVSGWIKDGKRGKFLSLSVKPKDETRNVGPGGARPSLKDDLDDEISF